MRLLFIANDFPNPLEPTKAVFNLQLIRALARRHEIQVISPISWVDEIAARRAGARMDRDRWAVIDGLSVHYPRYFYPPKILRSQYGWFYWRSIRALVKSLIVSQPPDAVLAYWAHPDGEAALRAARLAGVPSAVIVGGSDVQLITKNAARQRCVTRVLQSIDSVITVSQDLKTKVEAFGVEPDRVRAWSQGVDESVFFPGDKSAAKEKVGATGDGLQLLWVGRMVPVKGLEILLEACSVLRARKIDFHLNLIGDGPSRGLIEGEVAQRCLTNAVTFMGACNPEKLGDWYRAADLFVMSSWSEGLPNVLRESLACGTPFVASNVGGIAEIAGDTGALFPAGDASAMADRICAFVNGKRSGGALPKPLTWDESAQKIVEILNSTTRRPAVVREAGSPRSVRQMMRGAMSSTLPLSSFITHGPSDSPAVCLTFDDGPDPIQTPRVLDVLAENNVKATFFVLGEQAKKYPQLVRRIVAEGHTLGQHSFSHERGISAKKLIESVKQTQEALAQITPARVNLFRPPYGELTPARLWRLWRAKQTVVLWNRDPRDYARSTPEEILQWVKAQPLRGGDLVLLHDTHPHTAQALPDLIAFIRDEGLEFTTVDHWTTKPAEVSHELVSA